MYLKIFIGYAVLPVIILNSISKLVLIKYILSVEKSFGKHGKLYNTRLIICVLRVVAQTSGIFLEKGTWKNKPDYLAMVGLGGQIYAFDIYHPYFGFCALSIVFPACSW